MSKSEQYVLLCIKRWIWSGYYAPEQVKEMIKGVIESDCDTDMLAAAVDAEMQTKLDTKTTWPTTTHCDVLDQVFGRLQAEGVCALQNAGYTMSDGHTEVDEAVAAAPANDYTAYCFFHAQDVEHALDRQGLHIAFGSLAGSEDKAAAVGRFVTEHLRSVGLAVVWDETVNSRISLPQFDWKRRTGRRPSRADQIAEIAPLVREVFASSEDGEERSLCATFEVVGQGKAWVQVTATEINVAYPKPDHPDTDVGEIFAALRTTQLAAWEPNQYATWTFSDTRPLKVARVVDRALVKLFTLGEYAVDGKFEYL